MQTAAAELDVSWANNLSPNHKRLKRIDADITDIVKALARSDDKSRESVAKIICAGVQMLDIRTNDHDAWDDFKRADEDAHKLPTCKGRDKESREVAMVIWRRHRRDVAQSRERISVQGKAILIARNVYWKRTPERPEPVCKTPEELQVKISALGIKGLLKIGRTEKGEAQPKKITIPVPDRWTLYLIGPDSTREEVPDEIAQPVIARIQGLQ